MLLVYSSQCHQRPLTNITLFCSTVPGVAWFIFCLERRHYDDSGHGQLWSSWTEWTQCSVESCSSGTGYQSRQRVCRHHSHHHHHHHHQKQHQHQQHGSCKGLQTESRSCDSALAAHKCKGMTTLSSHAYLLLKPGFHSNAFACVSCGFRLRNASDCV